MDKLQLFCITHAGGTASFFRELSGLLEPKLDVHALEYAGHGTRQKEPLYENVDAMIKDIAFLIKEKRNPSIPYMVFGHSMGSMVAYETLTRYFLEDTPSHVFLASHTPPPIPYEGESYALLSDEDFIDKMYQFGALDKRLMEDQRFRSIYLPRIRADYRYLHEYHWTDGHRKFPCDITVFYSTEDIEAEVVCQWHLHTEGSVKLFEFSGGHFFLRSNGAEVTNKILAVADSIPSC